MHILVVAPAAPPKRSPEAMQVGRYLRELAKHSNITLVTTPVDGGWVPADQELALHSQIVRVLTITLPLHHLSKRVLASRYVAPWLRPDPEVWIAAKAANVIRQLHQRPDIIYSRSFPLSSALLGRRLKQRLGVPWVMHLSDPWAGNPYRSTDTAAQQFDAHMEALCVGMADAVAVTTEEQAAMLRQHYPGKTQTIIVSPNVMPGITPRPVANRPQRDTVNIVYTGALYGRRRPTALLEALKRLSVQSGALSRALSVSFVGNVQADIAQEIAQFSLSNVTVRGPVNFSAARKLALDADITLSIEPDGKDPYYRAFLPSKIVDYIAWGCPLLAMTPVGSPTWNLCQRGYGLAVAPDDIEGLTTQLVAIAKNGSGVLRAALPPLPDELSASVAVDRLMTVFSGLIERRSAASVS